MNFPELLSDPTFHTVALGTIAIGAVCGAIGCFAYLRGQSLAGDVIAHSSLLGIMLAFLASFWVTGQGSKSLAVLIPGAAIAGVLALALSQKIVNTTSVRSDSGLGVMLAIFFGTGILLLRWVQKAEPAIPGRRGLEDYLFGMAAAMTRADLVMIAIVGIACTLVLILFWKQLKLFTFDPLATESMGFKTRWLNQLMIVLLVSGIVIGIQSIGVVLIIAMLTAPAAAARQWTGTLGPMVCLAALFGSACALLGTIVSATWSGIPTGPVIVLVAATLFTFSLLFSPSRGVITMRIKRARRSRPGVPA